MLWKIYYTQHKMWYLGLIPSRSLLGRFMGAERRARAMQHTNTEGTNEGFRNLAEFKLQNPFGK